MEKFVAIAGITSGIMKIKAVLVTVIQITTISAMLLVWNIGVDIGQPTKGNGQKVRKNEYR